MAYTYSKIASYTVGSGGVATINFIAIPQNYTDLVLKISARSSDSIAVEISFNNTTSNQSMRRLVGDGSSASSNTITVLRTVQTGSTQTASTFGNSEVYIPNYAGNNYKSLSADGVNENNATEASTQFGAGLWSDSAAITSIKLQPNSGTFNQYSTATLYGIKAEV